MHLPDSKRTNQKALYPQSALENVIDNKPYEVRKLYQNQNNRWHIQFPLSVANICESIMIFQIRNERKEGLSPHVGKL